MINLARKTGKCTLAAMAVLVMTVFVVPDGWGRVVRRVYPEQPRYAFTPAPYVYGKFGMFNPNDESFPDGLDGYSSGFFGGLGLGYRSTPFLAFEGEIDFYETDFGSEDLRVTPIVFNFRFIYPTPSVEPYLEAGVGIYLAEFEFFNGFGIETDTGAGFGFHLGAGLDFKISPGIIAGIELRWFTAEPDFSDVFGPDPDVGGLAINFLLRALF